MDPEKQNKERNRKESYLRRRAMQLNQWDRVIKQLILRADKISSNGKTDLHRHIVKIQVKKARTEVILKKLNAAGSEKWEDIKAGLEKNWKELRIAFLKASGGTKQKYTKKTGNKN